MTLPMLACPHCQTPLGVSSRTQPGDKAKCPECRCQHVYQDGQLHAVGDPPAVVEVKQRARQMMNLLAGQDETPVRYMDCLHELSRQAEYRNWNSYLAALRKGAGLPNIKRQEARL